MTTKGSNNPFPSILLNEVATDGSDTPTPVADYQRLFLGEDGALHLIDSSDVVTSVGDAAAHIADTSDAHDASAISIADAGGHTSTTDVEAALQEIYARQPMPWALVPEGGTEPIADAAFAGSNIAIFRPIMVYRTVEMLSVYIRVGATSSGNISVGIYNEGLTRVATSGAVSCPATGASNVALSAAYTAAPGRYWVAMSCDNATATFIHCNMSGQGAPLAKNATSSHPLPAGPVTPGASNSRAPSMIVLITGGWTV